MMAMVAAGTLCPDLLVTRTVGLDDAPSALAAMSEPGMTMIAL
jgi:alcohol dehydrogenase